MSGPKCYRTPRFTTAVFDGKLRDLFELQGRIAVLVETLRQRSASTDGSTDGGRRGDSGGAAILALLAATEAERGELLAPYKLGDRGEFGEAIRHAFELHIDGRIGALADHLARLEATVPPDADPESSASPAAESRPAAAAAAQPGPTARRDANPDGTAAVALRARAAFEVADRERAFLRQHIVGSLERLGYQSIGEMRVLDFARPAHHLLRVAGQDNYVGLRFGDDDTLIYRFLVPDAPAQLDAAARRQKVAEMEASCRAFQRVLLELAALGVPLELERAVPAGEEALLQLPERYRAEVQQHRAEAAGGAAPANARTGRGPDGR